MLGVIRLANAAVRRAGITIDSVTGWFAKTSKAKWRRRPVRIVVSGKPARLGSGFGTGTRARRALAQTLFLRNDICSSTRNHTIRKSSAGVGCSPTRTGWLRDEWVLLLAHSWVLRQAWGFLIVYVVFNGRGGHKWDGGRLLRRNLSSLRRRVIGVVATWTDWRFPRFDFFVLDWSGGCASLATAPTTEETTAAEAEEGEEQQASDNATDDDADLGSFAQSMMSSSRERGS